MRRSWNIVNLRRYNGEGNAHRNRKVPTNSPAIAIKWFRGLLGILMKIEDGFGPCIFSSAPADVALVFGPLCRPKRPGKKPDLALILSIFAVCSCLVGPRTCQIRTTGRRCDHPDGKLSLKHEAATLQLQIAMERTKDLAVISRGQEAQHKQSRFLEATEQHLSQRQNR